MMGPVILVAEDDGESRQMIGEALGALFPGARIVLADSGQTALELAQRTPPAVALLDLQLPGMGGLELARRLRAIVPGASVTLVALTADMSPDTLLRAEAAGFAAFLCTPADTPRLHAVLRPILEEGTARAGIPPSRPEERADESDT